MKSEEQKRKMALTKKEDSQDKQGTVLQWSGFGLPNGGTVV
jgi:hypothetical protein